MAAAFPTGWGVMAEVALLATTGAAGADGKLVGVPAARQVVMNCLRVWLPVALAVFCVSNGVQS